MRRRVLSVWMLTAALGVGLTTAACGGNSSGGSGGGGNAGSSGGAGTTLTYWASNQGTSLDNDKQILGPELAKFQQQTGVKVNLEVIPWDSLLNRILAATTSGQGPDVLNIGNTWSASLQATGAFKEFDDATMQQIGGKDKFVASSLTSTGAPGKMPTAVPLYGLAYVLFYNKKMFADAGLQPPKTWQELESDAKKLTDPGKGQWGMTVAGASYTENAHFAFIFGKQQGADWINGDKADFTTPQAIAAVHQYVDLMSTQKVVNPSAAQHATTNDAVQDFTSGKAAMVMAQNNSEANIASNGMKKDAYGVVPIPVVDPLPAGGKPVTSHVAGINMSVFQDSKNEAAALKFVQFMTSKDEQVILNKAFGSLPVVKDAASDQAFQGPNEKVFNGVLANSAETLPMIANESQFETTVGQALRGLFGQAATGKPVDDAAIRNALSAAQQQMSQGG